MVVNDADIATQTGITTYTDPHLCVGADDFNSQTSHYTCQSHNATDTVYNTGLGDYKFEDDGGKGAALKLSTNTEIVTFAANPGDASKATVNLIPSGAFVVGVTTRVTTTATNCATVNIGDGTDADMFGSGIAVAQNTTSNNSNATAQFAMSPAIGIKNVTITGNANCFDGVWRVTAHYFLPVAATAN
jgi:hypothetical protein